MKPAAQSDILFKTDSISSSKSENTFFSLIRDLPLTALKYRAHTFLWCDENRVENPFFSLFPFCDALSRSLRPWGLFIIWE